MELPAPIFAELQPHFAHHGCWHVARRPGQDTLRALFPGECARKLFPLTDAGSGCDFLVFHRRMRRHFAWALARTAVPHFTFNPWPAGHLPKWVEHAVVSAVPGFNLHACYDEIARLIDAGAIEELGGFTEPNYLYLGRPGAGIHNGAHLGIDAVEAARYTGDLTTSMRLMSRAPGNLCFWQLHTWIDDLYAEWQRKHGQNVDLSPCPMECVHVPCEGDPILEV